MKKENLTLLLRPFFFFPVYIFSLLMPRNKRIWIYGSFGWSFIDNSKYLFIYANEHFRDVKHIWISPSKEIVKKVRSMGFLAYHRYSLKALYYALFSKVYIYSAAPTDMIHGCLKGNAFLFNLWHGVPFKKIEYDIVKGPLQPFYNPQSLKEKLKSFLLEPHIFRKSSAVLATSSILIDIYSSAFRISKDKILVGAYPRNLLFKFSREKLKHYINKYETEDLKEAIIKMSHYAKVIIYMPTWRPYNENFMNEALKDINALNEICQRYNILFLIKAHSATSFSEDLAKYTNVVKIDNRVDVYPLLPFTTNLITDYSSIIFDYSLLNKKITFYPFDKERYLLQDSEAYFKYEDIFSEKYTSSFQELLEEIELIGKEITPSSFYYPQCTKFVNSDQGASKILDFIKNEINY